MDPGKEGIEERFALAAAVGTGVALGDLEGILLMLDVRMVLPLVKDAFDKPLFFETPVDEIDEFNVDERLVDRDKRVPDSDGWVAMIKMRGDRPLVGTAQRLFSALLSIGCM